MLGLRRNAVNDSDQHGPEPSTSLIEKKKNMARPRTFEARQARRADE